MRKCFTFFVLFALSTGAFAIDSGRYVIVSKFNGNALDVESFSTADGANVMQWFALGGTNQQFDITALGDGSYSIRAVHSGKAVEVYDFNSEDGAEVRQWSYAGGDNQRWFIDDQGDGYYSITSKFSGRAMDVWGMNMFAGADVRLFSFWGGEGQLWTFQEVGSASECYAGANLTNRFVDCGGKTIGLSCNGDSESQSAVMTLDNSSVRNVRLAADGGADGIHCDSGNCTLSDVVWEDVCEDAATNRTDGGTMTVVGGSAYNSEGGYGGSPDKVFQHNSLNSTTIISGGFTLFGEHGKLWRSCGNCTGNGGPRDALIYDVNIDAEIGSVAGVNRNYGDTATIRDLRIRDYSVGDPNVCEEYQGVEKGNGESTKYGEAWNTAACDVSTSDVSAL